MTRVGFIKQAILEGPSGPLSSASMLVLAVMAPRLIGLAANPYVHEHAILAVYFPAIRLAAVLLGWRLGLIATALSILAACYLIVRPIPGPSAADIASAVYFFAAAALIVLFANTLRRTLVELVQR